ncbi:uncharacterized protein [Lepeophtheirus salmonis]|uniref:uncharacterized protein isoform X1 n=1 Tax=Lepeophtheirus salmonis TaxID=72036 RepID=UPI001AE7572D|nr:uncharacterized protein LOC121127569 isoform X1 [Lepeophtheirus salmonis]XP_040578918.1 uncharacterized protein LOC121127569 isoform X1 [Lepeophtheirus salmonis]
MAVDSKIETLESKDIIKKTTRFRHVRLSSVEDFSPGWVNKVIRSFYENNGVSDPPPIKNYHVELLADGLEFSRSESNESNSTETNEDLQQEDEPGGIYSTLSQSFRLVVEMDLESLKGGGGGVAGVGDAICTGERSPPALMAAKMHNLFVKVPLAKKAKFERIVKRNRTLSHEVQVYSGFIKDLQKFVKSRVGNIISLNIPQIYYGSVDEPEGDVLIIQDLSKKGYASRDWFKHRLTHDEVKSAVYELAKFHACGLAYRMSLNEEIEEKYTYLDDDLYTSNMAKELLAKYLDSYFHFLSVLPGIQEHVLKLRKISADVFSLLVKLRRPSDPLGKVFNTVCHGDMWMGNLMYNDNECMLVDFHSCQYLSPATDLAHLLLTSTDRTYRKKYWNEIIQYYYDTFNRTLAEFGLILRHLGTSYNDFLYEVKRALRGQFLCVAFIIPIVIYCGPGEWRIEKRRGSSVDRKNTVRHLMQMMSISEESALCHSHPGSPVEETSIPPEFVDLYNDEPLRNTLIDLIKTAADLDILDFQEFCKHIDTPRPMWTKTQATTGKHIPVY